MYEKFSLEGKVAVVTGASRGLGQGIAVGLAGAGADIVGVGRKDGEETRLRIEALGRRYKFIQADVGQKGAPEHIVEEAVKEFGRMDILVNAAGITHREMAIDVGREDFQKVLDVNLHGTFFMSQAAARQYISQAEEAAARGELEIEERIDGSGIRKLVPTKNGKLVNIGKIINIGSMTSFQGGVKVIPYTASKAAVRGMTQHMCNEWAIEGIHINCIAPGYMITNMTAPMRTEAHRMAETATRIPMERWGEPEDLAGTAIFLASDASDYVNGFTVAVDGGFLAKS